MKKFNVWSKLLSFAAIVTVITALGGLAVSAYSSENPAEYELSVNSYTIDHCGISRIKCEFNSLEHGYMIDEDGVPTYYTYEYVNFKAYHGMLSDGNGHSIPFYAVDYDMAIPDTDYYPLNNYSDNIDDVFSIDIFIAPSDYKTAVAGTYTGTLRLTSEWGTRESYYAPRMEGEETSIALSFVVPDSERYISSGQCGDNAYYTLDCDGVFTVSGTGSMYDCSEYDTHEWFSDRMLIKSVVIGDGITYIANRSFLSCEKLESVSLGSGIRAIGNEAFDNCFKLQAVSFPSNLQMIGQEAFYACVGISSVTIPDSCRSIGDRAFYGCYNLTSVSLPNTLVNLGNYVFAQSPITSVNIPTSLHSIPAGTFLCAKFTSIEIPSNITSIGESAFGSCDKLTSITIPDSVTSIGRSAFGSCEGLATIDLPDSITSIGSYAFTSTAIESMTIPDGITEIEGGLFANCQKLKSVTLPDSVNYITTETFRNCLALETVNIPEGVTELPYGLFMSCPSLKNVDLPSTLTTIGSNAFSSCGFDTFVIPEGVTYIGDDAFSDCKNLKSVEFSSTVTSISMEAFKQCESLETLVIPGNVKSIGSNAFESCYALKTVTLLDGVETVGDFAFEYCTSLETVTIPASAKKVYNSAFWYCRSVTDVYCYADPSQLEWADSIYSFNGTEGASQVLLHVPYDYKEGYMARFGTTVTVVGDAESEIDIGSGVHLYGFTLSLDGRIGMNFYLKLDSEKVDRDTAYMIFTVNGRTQRVDVKDITPNDQGYDIFRCDVAAKEMCDTITAQMYDGNGDKIGRSYSCMVRDYAAYILNRPGNYDTATLDLVKAMLNYGAYSQKYFNYNLGNLANSILDASEQDVSILSGDNLSSYALSAYGGNVVVNEDITLKKVNLEINSEITMNLTFEGVANYQNIVFKLSDGTVLPATISGDSAKVSIAKILPDRVNNPVEVFVYRDDSTPAIGSVLYSPATYCYNVLSRPTTATRTEALKENVSAFIIFCNAALLYQNI